MKKIIFLLIIGLIAQMAVSQTVNDVDGNVYNIVTVGQQIWLKENLKTTKYNDGTAILNIQDQNQWNNTTTPSFCWYDNNTDNGNVYGALYNWYAVEQEGLCPNGWRVPTISEWNELVESFGGEFEAGGKLKESGYAHWIRPNSGATNESGFTALPNGLRHSRFDQIGLKCWGWSSTEHSNSRAWCYNLHNDMLDASYSYLDKKMGISVRCIKNEATSTQNVTLVQKILISPNPCSEFITVSESLKIKRVNIYDIQGRKIKEWNNPNTILFLEDLSKGIYIINFESKHKNYTEKLIKR